MKIALGSTSIDKANILREALSQFENNIEILGCDVFSGITDQPLSEEVTIEGAVNRAHSAKNKQENCEIAFGLEGGLTEIQGSYFLVCVVALVDDQKRLFLGVSSKLELPKEISDKVKLGEKFGEVVRRYQSEHGQEKNIHDLLELLINRKQSFIEATKNAYLTFLSSEHYEK